ncbi:PEP-CTERM sorting domain-containing protein [Thalassotalea ganghwensis]
MTNALDQLFEADGGSLDAQYKKYTFDLDSSFFSLLTDGIFAVELNIGGSGLLTNGLTKDVSESNLNAYHLIASNLTITTLDASTPPTSVPEPSSIRLLLIGLFTLHSRKLKR